MHERITSTLGHRQLGHTRISRSVRTPATLSMLGLIAYVSIVICQTTGPARAQSQPPIEPKPTATTPAPTQTSPETSSPVTPPAETPPAEKPVTETPVTETPPAKPAEIRAPADPEYKDPIETEITLKDGRKITGEYIRQDSTRILLRIAGIETPLSMSDVDRVVQLPSVEDRYKQLRASIDPNDVGGLVRLSEWLLARKRYSLALMEVDRAIEADANSAVALQQRTLVIEQARLAEAGSVKTPTDLNKNLADKPLVVPRQPKEEFPFLTPDQINLIRVFEVDLKDPPRMFIAKEALDRFLNTYAGQGTVPETREGKDAFLRLRASKQLEAIFSVKARDFYSEVRVAENPAIFKRFRDDVQRGWVVNACATTLCHGGKDAGRFQLANIRPGSDEATYTNFLIIERYRTKDGLPLIDYAQPNRSPLLHLALEREVSLFPHPPTDGPKRWQPVFRSEKDEKFKKTLDWITGMFKPRPDYPIEYTTPGDSTAPTAEPAPR